MQTFLPYESFFKSAECLDNKRLGKQRVEACQILKTLLKGPITNGKVTPWYNHPAVQMWKGYDGSLRRYTNCMIDEWVRRKFKNTMEIFTDTDGNDPPWLGNEKFHASHRSNLLRKEYLFYSKFRWKEPDNLPYYWPTKNGGI